MADSSSVHACGSVEWSRHGALMARMVAQGNGDNNGTKSKAHPGQLPCPVIFMGYRKSHRVYRREAIVSAALAATSAGHPLPPPLLGRGARASKGGGGRGQD
ncbi:hypothetical protein PR202_ga31097 [Eleusine coracana subsp. coracana]|uniref:Uncharacterized protein n=1 Tax=Eleusine coracana subsp. coracana TaxID=191504 RepID=A0AAV5DRJ9_ELECO|nr:hypothetical protein PR202_ga31097 [Eleusine coracana subsp. coracana]